MIACFTQIVLGTTTRSMGDPNRFHIGDFSLLFLYNIVSAGLKQTHHSMLAIVIIQSSDFFFSLLLVLHSVRPKKEQVRENSGFAFTF